MAGAFFVTATLRVSVATFAPRGEEPSDAGREELQK